MNIGILAPHLRNAGGIRVLFSYANGLSAQGHEVTVYVQSTNTVRRAIANILQVGKPDWMRLAARVVRIPSLNKKYIGTHDHIIAGGYLEALALASWEKGQCMGWYLVQHDEGLYHGPRDLVDKALKSPLKKIVVSTWLGEVVMKRASQGSELLLNAYDRSQFYLVPKTPHDTVRVLVLDHSYEWKGTTEAVHIVTTLKKKYPNLVLVGMGRRRKTVAQLYDEYHFDPPQDCIRDIYGSADIFLSTSWYEGFGLPSLEAMACGTALVTYDNGGSRDFAFHEDTALVAPPKASTGSIDFLMQMLERLVTDSVLREQIAARGNAYVTHMPTWETQVGKLIVLLTAHHA